MIPDCTFVKKPDTAAEDRAMVGSCAGLQSSGTGYARRTGYAGGVQWRAAALLPLLESRSARDFLQPSAAPPFGIWLARTE